MRCEGKRDAANRGIERGKHPWRFEHSGLGQRIEQGGFARVGVAHQGYRGDRNRFAPLPLLRPDPAHIFDLLLHMPNAAIDFSPVGFKLSFSRTAGADTAAELRHLDAPATQPRQHVLKLCQLHLQLTFTGARVLGKDVQDELRPVDHARIHNSSRCCAAETR